MLLNAFARKTSEMVMPVECWLVLEVLHLRAVLCLCNSSIASSEMRSLHLKVLWYLPNVLRWFNHKEYTSLNLCTLIIIGLVYDAKY